MQKITFQITVLTVIFTILFFYLFGKNHKRLKVKPSVGFFASIMLIIMQLAGNSVNAQPKPLSPKTIDDEQFPEANIKVKKLNQTKEWKKFKLFVKELIGTFAKRKKRRNASHSEVIDPINSSQAETINADFKDALEDLSKLKEQGMITKNEFSFLNILCSEEIKALSEKCESCINCRQIPRCIRQSILPSFAVRWPSERKILITLLTKEKIDQQQYQEAFNSVNNELNWYLRDYNISFTIEELPSVYALLSDMVS